MTHCSDYFGMGVTDPWEIHGTREKRGVRPNEETYANRINKVKQICEKVPNDLLFKGNTENPEKKTE